MPFVIVTGGRRRVRVGTRVSRRRATVSEPDGDGGAQRGERKPGHDVSGTSWCCRPYGRRSGPSAAGCRTSSPRELARHRDEGGRDALRRGPGEDQLRDGGQLHPHRGALPLRRAGRVDPGRAADGVGGDGGEPAVFVGAAGHRHDGAEHPARRLRLGHRRRRRGDVARGLPVDGDAQRRPHGRHHDDRLDGGGADRPVRRRAHGHHGGEPGREVGHHAARSRTSWPPSRTAGPPRRSPRAASRTRSSRS